MPKRLSSKENLERGGQVNITHLGYFFLRPYVERSKKRKKMGIGFTAYGELRARLRLADPPVQHTEPCPSCTMKNPGMCATCTARKRHVTVYKEFRACINDKKHTYKKPNCAFHKV